MAVCNFCAGPFPSATAVRRHQSNPDSSCYEQAKSAFKDRLAARKATHQIANSNVVSETVAASASQLRSPVDAIADNNTDAGANFDSLEPTTDTPGFSMSLSTDTDIPDDVDAVPPPRQFPTVEEVEDVDGPQARRKTYIEKYPGAAGASTGRCKTAFEIIDDNQVLEGAEVWGPFKDDEEWQLAKWLIKNVGHGQADTFLKLPIVSPICYTVLE